MVPLNIVKSLLLSYKFGNTTSVLMHFTFTEIVLENVGQHIKVDMFQKTNVLASWKVSPYVKIHAIAKQKNIAHLIAGHPV